MSALGRGCMSMSGVYGAADEAGCIRIIQQALDVGVTLLDTADMYGWGHNEELVGRALRGRRAGVVVATKFGQVGDPAGGPHRVDGSPAHVRAACEASLRRVGVDVIDLYDQHRVDPRVPIEETVGAMARLREEGKIRALGLCETAPGSAVGFFEVLDAVHRGVLDAGLTWPGLWAGKNSAAGLFGSPLGGPFGMELLEFTSWLTPAGGRSLTRSCSRRS